MNPYVDDTDFTLHVGDVRDVLAGMPDESVHCVVTSPPYWGLRDYGTGSWDGGNADCDHKAPPSGGPNPERYTPGGGEMFRAANDKAFPDECGKCGARRTDKQLGLEPTPDEYVANMVAVFREVRRVLRRDGTCWLNLGSSYNAGTNADRKPTTTTGPDVPASWKSRSQSVRRDVSGDTPTSRSRPGAPAYGTDGRAPEDSLGLDSACLDLCDGCLDDWLTHRDRTLGTLQPHEQDVPLFVPTGRGSEPAGSSAASSAIDRTLLISFSRIILTAMSTKSRIMDSTSRPT